MVDPDSCNRDTQHTSDWSRGGVVFGEKGGHHEGGDSTKITWQDPHQIGKNSNPAPNDLQKARREAETEPRGIDSRVNAVVAGPNTGNKASWDEGGDLASLNRRDLHQINPTFEDLKQARRGADGTPADSTRRDLHQTNPTFGDPQRSKREAETLSRESDRRRNAKPVGCNRVSRHARRDTTSLNKRKTQPNRDAKKPGERGGGNFAGTPALTISDHLLEKEGLQRPKRKDLHRPK